MSLHDLVGKSTSMACAFLFWFRCTAFSRHSCSKPAELTSPSNKPWLDLAADHENAIIRKLDIEIGVMASIDMKMTDIASMTAPATVTGIDTSPRDVTVNLHIDTPAEASILTLTGGRVTL